MSVWQWGGIQNRGIHEKGSMRGNLVALTFTCISCASNEQRLPRTAKAFWLLMSVFQFVSLAALVTQ